MLLGVACAEGVYMLCYYGAITTEVQFRGQPGGRQGGVVFTYLYSKIKI